MVSRIDRSSGLILFSQIVRHGSLAAAAGHLAIGRASVSKQLKALEQALGARLLQRSTRRLSLTHVGAEILIEARAIEAALTRVETICETHQNRVSGLINVSCSSALGRVHLVPLLGEFSKRFPDIRINLQLEDRFVDLINEQFDVAIRIGHLQDSNLIARRLGELRWQLCASPDYLENNGIPEKPTDLLQHSCLYYQNNNNAMNIWGFTGNKGEEHITVNGGLVMNDAAALVQAAINGMGILNIDNAMVYDSLESGELLPLLPDYRGMKGLPVYLVYPARDFIPVRTQVFMDYLMQFMAPKI